MVEFPVHTARRVRTVHEVVAAHSIIVLRLGVPEDVDEALRAGKPLLGMKTLSNCNRRRNSGAIHGSRRRLVPIAGTRTTGKAELVRLTDGTAGPGGRVLPSWRSTDSRRYRCHRKEQSHRKGRVVSSPNADQAVTAKRFGKFS